MGKGEVAAVTHSKRFMVERDGKRPGEEASTDAQVKTFRVRKTMLVPGCGQVPFIVCRPALATVVHLARYFKSFSAESVLEQLNDEDTSINMPLVSLRMDLSCFCLDARCFVVHSQYRI